MQVPFLISLYRAGRGIAQTFRSEANFRRQSIVALAILALVLVLPLALWEIVTLLVVTSLVFVVELVNTSIERVLDLVKPQFHETVREAKDVSAGAVLMMSMVAALVGVLILGPYVIFLIRHV